MRVITVKVKKNEGRLFSFIWVNGKEKEIQIKATLGGDNASLIICGIFLGSKAKNIIFNTDVTHIGKNTKSLTTLRGVFFDDASFNNNGMVRIQKGAKNTNGFFQSKILLFDDAKGTSVPSLEIDENEVKAGHASTIGRPDPMQLFYLRSRGLSEKDAESLIVSGFFEPIIAMLADNEQTKVRTRLKKGLENTV